MRTTSLLVTILMLSTLHMMGCQCGSKDTGTEVPDETTPEEAPTPAPEDADAGAGVSAEVQALIEAGDSKAIAEDMGSRAAKLQTLATSARDHAKELETVAESMTGRAEPLDPRDPETAAKLLRSAEEVESGAAQMEQHVADLQQLVVDIRAEADALHGQPSP